MNGPSVDVLMLAYNVAPFIEQAVEGVLWQKADFPIRLVIAEDGSTDETPLICERLARENPARISYTRGTSNLGIAARTLAGFEQCQAEYVAICDADDVWTDVNKLAVQVGFLGSHPDHGLSFTDVSIIDRQGRPVLNDGYEGVRADYSGGWIFSRLLRGNFVNNSTAVFRRDLLDVLRPNACRDEIFGDHVRYLQISMRTKVHFLPVRTTAYRQGGISSAPGIPQRNRPRMSAFLPGLLLEHARCRAPITRWDAKVLLRKTVSAIRWRGTGPRTKAALLPLLIRYLPAMIGILPPPAGRSGTWGP